MLRKNLIKMKLHGLKTRVIFCFRIPWSGILPGDHSSIHKGALLQTWYSGCRIKFVKINWFILFYFLSVSLSWATWRIQTIETGGVGEYPSLTIGNNNILSVSYYDAVNKDLKYAQYDGIIWSTQTIDSTGNVGEFTSIAKDSNNNSHISYYDYDNQSLKYAKWNGSAWDIQNVENGIGYNPRVYYTSIIIDNNDNPQISYCGYALKYAKWTGSSWVIQTVDSSGMVGWYSSLAIDKNNNPHISYYDHTNNDLKYAKWTGSSWFIETIDSTDAVGWYTSMVLDSNNNPHISYCDTRGYLKYVVWTGIKWNIERVVSSINCYWAKNNALVLDINEYPHIVYYDDNSLKYVEWMPNNNPILSWTGETNYISDGLNPEIGEVDRSFIYRIKYADLDNDPPKTGYPKIYIKKSGMEISDSPFTMSEEDETDKTYTDGKLYTYSTILPAGTDYEYYFEGYDVYNASATGFPITEIDAPDVFQDITPPAQTINLTIVNPYFNSLTLIWTAPGDDGTVGNIVSGKYWVRYSTSSNFTMSNSDIIWSTNIIPGNIETKTITGLSVGKSYYFVIKTADESDNWSVWSTIANGTTLSDAILPNPIIDLRTTSSSNGNIELSWTASTDNYGIKEYKIFRSIEKDILGIEIFSTTQTDYTDSSAELNHGTSYYYTIQPIDLANNIQTVENNQSGALCDKIPPITEWTFSGPATYYLRTEIVNDTTNYYFNSRPGNTFVIQNASDPLPGTGILNTEVINDITFSIFTYPYTVISRTGFFTEDIVDMFNIYSVDNASNEEEIIPIEINWDVTAPNISIDTDINYITTVQPITIYVESDEDLIIPPEVTVCQNGLIIGTQISMTSTNDGSSFQGTYNVVFGYNGSAKIVVKAKDTVGYENIDVGFFNIEINPEETLYEVYCDPEEFSPTEVSTTNIHYTLTQQADILIGIYSPNNVLVKSFNYNNQLPSCYSIIWDGKDSSGNIVNDDIYRIEIKAYISGNQIGLTKNTTVTVLNKRNLSYTETMPSNITIQTIPNPPELITDALFAITTGNFNLIGSIYNITPNGTQFQPSAQLLLKWNDANNNGIVDETEGTDNPIDETNLDIYKIILPTTLIPLYATKDIDNNTLIANISSLSLYAILASKVLPIANVDIKPDSINIKSEGKDITCYIELPKGYNVKNLKLETVRIAKINGNIIIPIYAEIKPAEVGDYDKDKNPDLMVKFDREKLQQKIPESVYEIKVTIRGSIGNIDVEGDDIVKIAGRVFAAPSIDASFILRDAYAYPNPAKNGYQPTLHVECGVADYLEIQIFNIAGELVQGDEVYTQPIIKNNKYAYEYTWDISDKASGVYLYLIKAHKANEKTIKVLKKLAIIK